MSIPYPTSYIEARETFNNRRGRIIAGNTTLARTDEGYAVHYHSTDVVTFFEDGSFKLNTNGWRTPTSKERMNACSTLADGPVRGVNFQIWQTDHEWYIEVGVYLDRSGPVEGHLYPCERVAGKVYEYADGMVIRNDGSVTREGETLAPIDESYRTLMNRKKVIYP
jgi:hypothetical protein